MWIHRNYEMMMGAHIKFYFFQLLEPQINMVNYQKIVVLLNYGHTIAAIIMVFAFASKQIKHSMTSKKLTMFKILLQEKW